MLSPGGDSKQGEAQGGNLRGKRKPGWGQWCKKKLVPKKGRKSLRKKKKRGTTREEEKKGVEKNT